MQINAGIKLAGGLAGGLAGWLTKWPPKQAIRSALLWLLPIVEHQSI